jgi:TniQ/Domain of unknown function (DUF5655)
MWTTLRNPPPALPAAEQASIQVRWADPPLRPLPIRVPPFPNEAVRSYVRRLEAANHLGVVSLDEHLRVAAAPDGPSLAQRLGVVSGWPVGVLEHALPELRGFRPVLLTGLRYRVPRGFDQTPRRACRHCVARREISGEVTCWVPPNLDVCLRHQRWIGPTNQDDADQFDLAPVPEVVAAARRYRRLTRRLGDFRVESAYPVALHITLRWAERADFGQHRDRRLRVLGIDPDRFRLAAHLPAMRAAVYPDTVTLAGLLASPHWLGVAASLDHGDHQRFYAEVARRLRLPDYQPTTGWDPLARWVDRDAPQHFREAPPPRHQPDLLARVGSRQWTIDGHLVGKPPAIIALYHRFVELVEACGPSECSVSTTGITFNGSRRRFAGAGPTNRGLDGHLELRRRLQDPRIRHVTPLARGLVWHRFRVSAADQLDDEFAGWVREAYEVGQGVHLERPGRSLWPPRGR